MTVALVLILIAAMVGAFATDHAFTRQNPRAVFFAIVTLAAVILAAAERIAIAIAAS